MSIIVREALQTDCQGIMDLIMVRDLQKSDLLKYIAVEKFGIFSCQKSNLHVLPVVVSCNGMETLTCDNEIYYTFQPLRPG